MCSHSNRSSGLHSDNGPEFNAQRVRDWIAAVGARSAGIKPVSPWEDECSESFNARFRDELPDGEIFHPLGEAHILTERWRVRCNTVRPHSALGHRPPMPESIVLIDQGPAMHWQQRRTTPWGHVMGGGSRLPPGLESQMENLTMILMGVPDAGAGAWWM